MEFRGEKFFHKRNNNCKIPPLKRQRESKKSLSLKIKAERNRAGT